MPTGDGENAAYFVILYVLECIEHTINKLDVCNNKTKYKMTNTPKMHTGSVFPCFVLFFEQLLP